MITISTGYTLEIYDGTEESAEKVAGNVDKVLLELILTK